MIKLFFRSQALFKTYCLVFLFGIMQMDGALLHAAEQVGNRKLMVAFPDSGVTAGTTVNLKVAVEGGALDAPWQVWTRPSDGSDLHWTKLVATFREGSLAVAIPEKMRGLHDLVVRCGTGPIPWVSRAQDLSVQKTLVVCSSEAVRSVSAISSSGRSAFRQGEEIPVQLVRQGEAATPGSNVPVGLTLQSSDGRVITTGSFPVVQNAGIVIPAAVSGRLPPGRYQLEPAADGCESYPLTLDIAPGEPDSPMQRLLYHEFDSKYGEYAATTSQPYLADMAERQNYIREHARAVADAGFTRETDRYLLTPFYLSGGVETIAWNRNSAPMDLSQPGCAPPEYYGYTPWQFEPEAYLDQSVRRGIVYDNQLLAHCSGLRPADGSLTKMGGFLQRIAQWMGRYPAFYGFNYNDEMFGATGIYEGSTQEDADWCKQTEAKLFPGQRHPENTVWATRTLMLAQRTMYDQLNTAVHQALPPIHTTATPMWQFPAVEGSYAPLIYQGMSETYTHYLSEGYHIPWYPAHSVEFLRRPGLPLMGVFDVCYNGTDGECYLKNSMQVLARGVQGVGVSHADPLERAKPMLRATSAYRLANELARMYGSIFAETPPANEAAILYSSTQDLTENRNWHGTPHWERVLALFGAGLMAGVPAGIVYEEDIQAGWLLDSQKKKPHVPMLFLVGQKQTLPARVQAGINDFIAAGGKVFTDADCAPYPQGTALPFVTSGLSQILRENPDADSVFPPIQAALEHLADDVAKAVGPLRKFPIDTSDSWVSKNVFDGGAIRYLMLASETSPYPWSPEVAFPLLDGNDWRTFSGTWLPKQIDLTFPAQPGVVYDVFEHTLVTPAVFDGKAKLRVDLSLFPGRLYALVPAELGAPRVAATVKGEVLNYQVDIGLAARVPLRIRLLDGNRVIQEFFRGSDSEGHFVANLPLPAIAGTWRIEVAELLGGKATVAALPNPALAEALAVRSAVDIRRDAQIRSLLQESGGYLTLITARPGTLSPIQVKSLTDALAKQQIILDVTNGQPSKAKPGNYLAVGIREGSDREPDFFVQAWLRGLYDFPLSANVPGQGRGLITALYGARALGENAIALAARDPEGIEQTVRAFTNWLVAPALPAPQAQASPATIIPAAAAPTTPLSRLSERVGVRLNGVCVAQDGKHLLVTAEGYHRNLALVEDDETTARVQSTFRVGQATTVDSPFVSLDGRWVGASARVISRYGEAFHLFDTRGGKVDAFPCFGDMGRQKHHFAASSTGDIVLAPGTYGVTCWQRSDAKWKEAWVIDYWKEFDHLDWPVTDYAERIPQFDAVIPTGSDQALILFGEFSPRAWLDPKAECRGWLAAVGLNDGKERWRIELAVPKTPVFPKLWTSPDGSRVVLETQIGFDKTIHRFQSVIDGQLGAAWDTSPTPVDMNVCDPVAVAVADATGTVAVSSRGRLLEVRSANGVLLWNTLWNDQPTSLAFAADGHSLYVADNAGNLTLVDPAGVSLWNTQLGVVSAIAAQGDRVFAAGWDGRLRSFNQSGKIRWSFDCTPAMHLDDAMTTVAGSTVTGSAVHTVVRPATTTAQVPAGENLLRTGKATLTVGGTPGWKSVGCVLHGADVLTNGQTNDVNTPWLSGHEAFWDATAGRQIWMEISFNRPTTVSSLTVYEHPGFPDSWPTESLIQVWDADAQEQLDAAIAAAAAAKATLATAATQEARDKAYQGSVTAEAALKQANQKWKTVTRGLFLTGPLNTYKLGLKDVRRLRYLPWNSYYRNFYTTEIEVR